MTKEEYQKLLESHDWYYHYSDDHRVWKRGQKEREDLRHYAGQSPELQEMMTEYSKRFV